MNEIIEKKSRFIGYAAAASTEDEANLFITGISKEHKKANNAILADEYFSNHPIQI